MTPGVQSGTENDLSTDIGLDIGVASEAGTATAVGVTTRGGLRATNTSPPTRAGPPVRPPSRPPTGGVPDDPDEPETDQSSIGFGFNGEQASGDAADRGPAVGWAAETFTAFVEGGFGNRRLPDQVPESSLGMELPTSTLSDPVPEQEERIEAVSDLFWLTGDEGGEDDDFWVL